MKYEFNLYTDKFIEKTCLIIHHHKNIVGYGRLLEINYTAFIEIYLSVPSKS